MKRPRRREFLAALGGLGSLGASTAIGPDGIPGWTPSLDVSVPAGVWQGRGRDPRRSGYAADATGPTTDPSEQWSLDIDVTTPQHVDSLPPHPAVDPERVYALDGKSLVAIDREDGRVDWRFDPPEVTQPPEWRDAYGRNSSIEFYWRNGPIYRDGRVFVTARASSGRTLYAVDAGSGSMEWALPTFTGRSVLGDAVLAGELVNVSTGRVQGERRNLSSSPIAVYPTHTVYEFPRVSEFLVSTPTWPDMERIQSGEIDEDIVVSYREVCDPTVTSSGLTLNVKLGDDSTRLYTLDVTTGEHEPLIEQPPSVIWAATDDETWYLFADELAGAYPVVPPSEGGDTSARWQRQPLDVVGTPALTDDAVYVPTTEGVAILDTDTGELLSRIGETMADGQRMTPAVVDDTLYCYHDGTFHAYR